MTSLANFSRLYLLALLRLRGPLTRQELESAQPAGNGRMKVDLGRGATVSDYIDVMVREGVVVEDNGRLALTPLGDMLLERLAEDVRSLGPYLQATTFSSPNATFALRTSSHSGS